MSLHKSQSLRSENPPCFLIQQCLNNVNISDLRFLVKYNNEKKSLILSGSSVTFHLMNDMVNESL